MAQYVQNYTFTNGTTADGGQVDSEVKALGTSVNNIVNAQIASDAAIAISKTTLGTYIAPTAYTPTLVQTGAVTKTVSNARYTQTGKKISGEAHLVCTGAGTGNSVIYIGLPVSALNSNQVVGKGFIYNADIAYVYTITLRTPVGSSDTVMGIVEGSGGTQGAGVTPNFALANNDEINISFEYEAA